MIEVLPTLQHSTSHSSAHASRSGSVCRRGDFRPGGQTSFFSRTCQACPHTQTHTQLGVSRLRHGELVSVVFGVVRPSFRLLFALVCVCVYPAPGVRMPSASTLFSTSGNKIQAESTQADGKTYEQLRKECLQRKQLFEDPDFPAKGSSLFYSQSVPVNFEWKRPGVRIEPHRRQQESECNIKRCFYFISSQEQEIFQLIADKWIRFGFESNRRFVWCDWCVIDIS